MSQDLQRDRHMREEPPETESEFLLGKPYIIPADAKNRFREYVTEELDRAVRNTWEKLEKVLTAFPVNAQSEPASDLARDDDAQSEPEGDLQQRLRAAITGEMASADPSAYRDAAVYGAMSVVQPELDRIQADLDTARYERDKYEGYWQDSIQDIGAVSRALEQALGREYAEPANDLPGMVEMLRRRAETAEGERGDAEQGYRDAVERVAAATRRAETAESGMEALREERDAQQIVTAMTRHERDTALAERDEYRQAAEAEADLDDESQASVRRLRDERGALRSYLTAIAAILGEDSSDPNRIVRAARGAVSERDRLDELADERRSTLIWEQRGREEWERNAEDAEQRCANAEREQDQLQARIDRVYELAGDYERASGGRHTSLSVAADIRQALDEPDEPDDDGSEAEGDEPAPPFHVGQWVRLLTDDVVRVAEVAWLDGHWHAITEDAVYYRANEILGPWQPRPGERVTARQLCGAGVGPHVTGRYQHEPDVPDTVVTDSAVIPVVHYTLRPAEGGDD